MYWKTFQAFVNILEFWKAWTEKNETKWKKNMELNDISNKHAQIVASKQTFL